MTTSRLAMLFACALLARHAVAAPPAYDGVTPMIEMGPMWFDPAMTAEEQQYVAQSVLQAQANMVTAYGERRATPRIVWCKTKGCVSYFSQVDGRSYANVGNGKPTPHSKYTFTVPTLILTRQARFPKNVLAVETLTHEMSHLELRARTHNVPVPSWFNEGIATYLGNEQAGRCTPGTRGIDDLTKVADGKPWREYTSTPMGAKTYCQARNEVAAWMTEHGGFAAVLDLLAKRANGVDFNALYGPLREALPGAQTAPPLPSTPVTPDDNTS